MDEYERCCVIIRRGESRKQEAGKHLYAWQNLRMTGKTTRGNQDASIATLYNPSPDLSGPYRPFNSSARCVNSYRVSVLFRRFRFVHSTARVQQTKRIGKFFS